MPREMIILVHVLAIGLMPTVRQAAAQRVTPLTGPQPTVRTIVTIPGLELRGQAVLLPNGRVVLYTSRDSILAYDLRTKHATLVTPGFFGEPLSISPNGTRIAFRRPAGGGVRGQVVWTVPIDSNSGAATGPAQQASATTGGWAALSPDGRLVAFGKDRDGDSTRQDLAVVAAIGGTERILATYGVPVTAASWSSDGKWVFVETLADTLRSLDRVPVAGGPGERVFSYPRSAWGTIDGRVALYWADARAPSQGRIAFVTASGARGEFRIPVQAWPADFVWSAQSLLTRTTTASTAHVLTPGEAGMRSLKSGTLLTYGNFTSWSPDGRRIAMMDSTGGRLRLTVLKADGTEPRHFPVTLIPTEASLLWSPDGRLLAYYAGGGATTLGVLDPATGKTRTVFSAPDASHIVFVWRPDGQSIVLVKFSSPPRGRRLEVFEVRLDGTSRKLRDVDNEFTFVGLISDTLLLRGNDGDVTNVYGTMPTDSGLGHTLLGGVGRAGWPGVSADGRWLLFLLHNKTDRGITSVGLVTTRGDSSHTLSLPFEAQYEDHHFRPFHPDGRHLVLAGKAAGDSVSRIFLVPIDGTAPRALVALPTTSSRVSFDFSPDGRSLVYTLDGAPTSTIYELDLRPILQSVVKR